MRREGGAVLLFIWRRSAPPLLSRAMAKPQKGAPVPVVVMGLGFIGQEVARAALSSEEVELIGAVDVSPHLAGKKLSDVLKVPAGTFAIAKRLEDAVGSREGVVLMHA